MPATRSESADFSRSLNDLRQHLVLRVLGEQSPQYAKEIRALDPELILREVPGKSVERSTHSQRLGRPLGRAASDDPPRDEVARIPCPPLRLRLRPTLLPALRRGTRALSISDTRVWTKPLSTEPTGARTNHSRPTVVRPLLQSQRRRARLRHGGRGQRGPKGAAGARLSRASRASPRRAKQGRAGQPRGVGRFWRADPGHFRRASKVTPLRWAAPHPAGAAAASFPARDNRPR